MADICDLCHCPAVQDANGNWVHAEIADAVFCGLVMRAGEQVAAPGDADE